jgi:Fungal chitosanase of glycosyl hydrolase group 75
MTFSTSKQIVATIAGVNVHKLDADGSLVFVAGMEVDADGSPHAYHPEGKGLDSLSNAKDQHGRFVGIVVDHNGRPAVQGDEHPAPGFFVSTTSLEDPSKESTDPARYVDSETVPYIVLPAGMPGGAQLGDFAVLVHTSGDVPPCFAICADTGPHHKIGEASIAAATQLKIPSSPKNGGTEQKVIQYIVFVGSGNGRPRTLYEINEEGARLFEEWGGMERVAGVFS